MAAAASTEGLVSLLRFSALGGGMLYGYAKHSSIVNSKRAALSDLMEEHEAQLKGKDAEVAGLKKEIFLLENPDYVEEPAPSFWEALFGKRE